MHILFARATESGCRRYRAMALRHQHLHQAQHHLAEIDEHITAQRSLVEELRADGQDAAEAERLLHNLLEAQLLALAHWRLATNPPN